MNQINQVKALDTLPRLDIHYLNYKDHMKILKINLSTLNEKPFMSALSSSILIIEDLRSVSIVIDVVTRYFRQRINKTMRT